MPKPGECVWTLVKAGRRFDFELRFQDESYGCECQVLEDGEIRFGQRFLSHGGAAREDEATGQTDHSRLADPVRSAATRTLIRPTLTLNPKQSAFIVRGMDDDHGDL